MMTDQEKAAFFEELCSRGIAMYVTSEDCECGHQYYVRKTRTFVDERIYLNAETAILGFDDRESAIQFIQSYIGWTFEQPKEPDETQPTTMYEFVVTVMVDFGFGPQTIDLGKIANICEKDGWQEEVQKTANTLARKYIAKNHPDKKWGELSKQVGIMPV